MKNFESTTDTSPLYPAITPYKSGMMETGDGHKLYWEMSGNPNGIPAVVLHGGPGSGTSPWQRTLFNPSKYNIILFDQRGSGKSTPHASLDNNTTPHLVADLDLLRISFGISKWVVFGGSWGSTLALAYADKHAHNISALVMYGIFLARDEELRDLYYADGIASKVFPDAFEPYINFLPENKRTNPIQGYKELFESSDSQVRLKALDLWTRLEKRVSRLVVTDKDLTQQMADPEGVLAHSLLENHYFLSNGFIDGNEILKRMGKKLTGVPTHIVQGRYDMVCPFITAYELHNAVPHSMLHILDDAGHSATEPKVQRKLVEILNTLSI